MKNSPERMWINRPSMFQQHYKLHGTRVLAVRDTGSTYRVYFLEGDTVSMQVEGSQLSRGWPV